MIQCVEIVRLGRLEFQLRFCQCFSCFFILSVRFSMLMQLPKTPVFVSLKTHFYSLGNFSLFSQNGPNGFLCLHFFCAHAIVKTTVFCSLKMYFCVGNYQKIFPDFAIYSHLCMFCGVDVIMKKHRFYLYFCEWEIPDFLPIFQPNFHVHFSMFFMIVKSACFIPKTTGILFYWFDLKTILISPFLKVKGQINFLVKHAMNLFHFWRSKYPLWFLWIDYCIWWWFCIKLDIL